MISGSVVSDSLRPMDGSIPGFPVLHSLPELAQAHVIELVMSSNHFILCCPLLLLPSIFSSIRVCSNELAPCIRWPKCWSFSISPSNRYPGLIPLGLIGLISYCSRNCQDSSPTPQFKSINSLALSLLYGPNLMYVHYYWKTIALTLWTIAGKVMSQLFNNAVQVCHSFSSKDQVTFNFMAAFWSPRK